MFYIPFVLYQVVIDFWKTGAATVLNNLNLSDYGEKKSKNKRFRQNKPQPTALPSVKETRDDDEELATVNPAEDIQLKTIRILERVMQEHNWGLGSGDCSAS